jgi:hypothetical protein
VLPAAGPARARRCNELNNRTCPMLAPAAGLAAAPARPPAAQPARLQRCCQRGDERAGAGRVAALHAVGAAWRAVLHAQHAHLRRTGAARRRRGLGASVSGWRRLPASSPPGQAREPPPAAGHPTRPSSTPRTLLSAPCGPAALLRRPSHPTHAARLPTLSHATSILATSTWSTSARSRMSSAMG